MGNILEHRGMRRIDIIAVEKSVIGGGGGFGDHMARDNVGSLGAEQMANATPGDALIAISFAPYTPFTIDLARKARERATPIVVITDSPLSPLAGLADARFEIAESDFGSFRSLAATFCLAITLAVALADKRAGVGGG